MSYPYPDLNFDPYASQGSSDPYAPQNMPGQDMPFSQDMPDHEDGGDVPYALDQMEGSPYGDNADAYAEGGRVGGDRAAPLFPLAEMLKGAGRHGDTMLAHINPVEAMILKSMGGSGTINPRTGLPEYWNPFKSIDKVFKKLAVPAFGSLLGNMILPGSGALIGGGIGGMFGHPNQRMGPLAGAGIGAFTPFALNGLGGLISGGGATGAGGILSSLAGQTANPLTSLLMPNMVSNGSTASPFSLSSMISGGNSAASTPFSMNPVEQLSSTLAPQSTASSPGFLASLMKGAGAQGGGMGGYLGQFLQPQNALSSLMVGNAIRNQPPSIEKQYRAQAEGQKYLDDTLHAPDRMRDRAKLERELEREKWEPLAESADDFETEQASPEEYERTGKWFRKYKKNPQGQRVEVPYARGGEVGYLHGVTGGQDDRIPAWLSDGEYVMDANTVSALGDGNNTAGAQRLDDFRKKLLKHKGMKKMPPKSRPLESYLH